MIRGFLTSSAVVSFLLLTGCGSPAPERTVAVEQKAQPEPTFVAFDLDPQKTTDGSQQYIGSYSSAGKTARFRMDFGPDELVPGKTAGEPGSKSGEGTILPDPASDSSAFLAELQKALRAKTAPVVPATKTSVPFTYYRMEEHLSQAPGGTFSANPPGDWNAFRLIFGDGPKQSEIFLHINSAAKKAQFSMKDPSYGDLVLPELAKVL